MEWQKHAHGIGDAGQITIELYPFYNVNIEYFL